MLHISSNFLVYFSLLIVLYLLKNSPCYQLYLCDMCMVIAAKSKMVGEKLVVTFFLIERKALVLPGHAMEKSPLYPLLKTVSKLLNLFLYSHLYLYSLLLGEHFPLFSPHLSMLTGALCVSVGPSPLNADFSHVSCHNEPAHGRTFSRCSPR